MEFFILFPLIFAPLAFAGVEPWALAILQLTAFSSASILLIRGRPLYKNILNTTFLPAILAIAFLGLCQALRENPVNAPAVLLFTAWRPATLNAVLLWLFYAAVMFSVPQIIRTPGQFKRLLWVVFGLGVALTVYGMLQKTGDNSFVYGLRFVKGETFGPFVNRDHACTFLLMAAMIGIGLFFFGFRKLLTRRETSRFFDLLAIQFLLAVMLCAILYGVAKTGSRGGLHSLILAVSAMAFAFAWLVENKTRRFIAVAFVVLLLSAAGVFFYYNRILLGVSGGALVHSVTLRLMMYKSGFEMLKDFPLLGTGLGAIEHAFPYYQRQNYGLVRHVHSDWLELFLQTGLIGGLDYLAGFAAAMRGFFRVWINRSSLSVKLLHCGVFGAVLAACLHNLVDFGSQMPANALLFYTLIGALASKPVTEGYKSGYDAVEEEPQPLKKTAALSLAVCFGCLMLLTIPQTIGWWYDYRAKDAPCGKSVVLREAALKWSPSPRYAFRLGADYFNQSLKAGSGAYDLFGKSLLAIERYQLRVPVNSDLLSLQKDLLIKLSLLTPVPRYGVVSASQTSNLTSSSP